MALFAPGPSRPQRPQLPTGYKTPQAGREKRNTPGLHQACQDRAGWLHMPHFTQSQSPEVDSVASSRQRKTRTAGQERSKREGGR